MIFEMDGIMLVLLAPERNMKKLQWYRFWTGCLMIYGLILTVTVFKMESSFTELEPVKSQPWHPYIEYPFPAISIISSLLMMPAVLIPRLEFRNYLLPSIIMNIYLAFSYLANGIFTTIFLFYNHILTTWPYQFILYVSLTLIIHCFLIKAAISYYVLLWPEQLIGVDNVAPFVEEINEETEQMDFD